MQRKARSTCMRRQGRRKGCKSIYSKHHARMVGGLVLDAAEASTHLTPASGGSIEAQGIVWGQRTGGSRTEGSHGAYGPWHVPQQSTFRPDGQARCLSVLSLRPCRRSCRRTKRLKN